MATYYTDWANGNDNITSISGATFTESTKNLNKASAFTNYTVNMRIHINAGTAVIDGIYKVVTVTDNDNVVLESTITSDASDPTDVGVEASAGTSEGAAWATINHAMNQVGAGDKVWVQSGTDYSETATISQTGGSTTWIVFEGYGSSIGDGVSATIDGGSSRANGITTSTGSTYTRLENIIIENCTGNGFNSSTADAMVFVNCQFNSNGGIGAVGDNAMMFVNCSANGNTTHGLQGDISATFISCTAHNNTQKGMIGNSNGSTMYNCIASYNGAEALSGKGQTAAVGLALNCTVDGNGKVSNSGYKVTTGGNPVALVNCIFYDCAEGIDGTSAAGAQPAQVGINNLVNSNTDDYVNWGSNGTDVTGAPAFTDEGSQDYTLGTSSAAKDAGADASGPSSAGMDIGALQSAPPATTNILIRPRRTM